MLTVYMDCGSEDRHLALTLAELVSGSVEGVVRNVVLIDRGMSADARMVADQSGCRIIAASDLETSFSTDRADWFLWLETGSRPMAGWTEDVVEYAEPRPGRTNPAMPARFKPAAKDRPSFLARFKTSRTALTDGVLIRKPQAVGLVKQRGSATLAELAKGLATKRLNAELRPKRAAD